MEVPVFTFRPVDETIHVDETKLVKEACLVCDSCGKISQSKSLLYKHRLTHQKLDLPCKLCSKICTTKKNLREHIINVHGQLFTDKCELCGKFFIQRGLLKEHLSNGNHKCDFCDKVFCTKQLREKHKKDMHKVIKMPKIHKCDIVLVFTTQFIDKIKLQIPNNNKILTIIITQSK